MLRIKWNIERKDTVDPAFAYVQQRHWAARYQHRSSVQVSGQRIVIGCRHAVRQLRPEDRDEAARSKWRIRIQAGGIYDTACVDHRRFGIRQYTACDLRRAAQP